MLHVHLPQTKWTVRGREKEWKKKIAVHMLSMVTYGNYMVTLRAGEKQTCYFFANICQHHGYIMGGCFIMVLFDFILCILRSYYVHTSPKFELYMNFMNLTRFSGHEWELDGNLV